MWYTLAIKHNATLQPPQGVVWGGDSSWHKARCTSEVHSHGTAQPNPTVLVARMVGRSRLEGGTV